MDYAREWEKNGYQSWGLFDIHFNYKLLMIVLSLQARSAYARGDMAGARTASASARQLTNISIIAGVASIIVAMIIVGVYVGLIMTNLRT